MRKTPVIFIAGLVLGVGIGLAIPYLRAKVSRPAEAKAPEVCYSCFWQGYDPQVRTNLVEYFKQYKHPDPLVMADVGYILWRITSQPNCDLRGTYERIGDDARDPM